MVDFSKMLAKPADNIKKPPVLPAGTYFGVVKDKKLDESKEKKTPFVQYNVAQLRPGEDVDQEALAELDIGKKTLKCNFYLTDDSEFRVVEFAKSFGVEVAGKVLGEVIEVPVGREVMVQVKVKFNQQTNEPFNEIGDIRGVAG